MSVPVDSSCRRDEGRTPSPVSRSSSSPDSNSDGGTAAERFTDDLLVEILSRVPTKSLCRFRCVSSHWLGLIGHHDHRKKLPQTLTGFFYTKSTMDGWVRRLESPLHFAGVSGSRRRDGDTSNFAFLSNHPRLEILHCCNGLLVGCWYYVSNQGNEFRYLVCNPATEKWVALPDNGHSQFISPRLGFDPAFSPHFHVFEWVDEQDFQWEWDEWEDPDLAGVAVYSSETGGWVYKEKTWNEHIRLTDNPATVFLNGYLHFLADDRGLSDCLAVVDTKGETWMNFPVPGGGLNRGFIQGSQGRLNYANFRGDEDGAVLRLVVYVLENYQSKEWILTHSVETSYLFGGLDVRLDEDFYWVAIHPDCNLVFFAAGRDNTLMCYNMDRRQVKVISNLEGGKWRYLPYVPFYQEFLLLHL